MGIKRFDPGVWIGDRGMQFAADGEDLLIQARFSRLGGDLDQFLMDLQGAILLWVRQHPYLLPSTDAANEKSFPAAKVNARAKKKIDGIRFPETPEEQIELERLAENGPAVVYTWIYGPNSLMAKAMTGTTWKQFGVENATEGCRRVLSSIRSHHSDLRVVRSQLRRSRLLIRR